MINRFSVPLLSESTIHLANVASANKEPDKVLFNARILSTYSEYWKIKKFGFLKVE